MIKLILLGLMILFLFTRLYQIGQLPLSVYWDEASIGYNAYAISIDGKDEWGETLPLHFRAFSEFKLPVYIYSTVPFVKVLGLNAQSVRLPAVIFSLFTLLGCYFVAKKLFSQRVGIFTVFLLIISPWFLLFSRVGYEVSAGLALFVWGIYFYLMKKNAPWAVVVSVICLVGSMYSYNSYRVLVPLLLIIGTADIFWSKWYQVKKHSVAIVLSLIIILLSLFPIYRLMSGEGLNRFQTVGLSRETTDPIKLSLLFADNYLKHFEPGFLFLNGDDNPRSHVPGFGELLLPTAVLLLIGLFSIKKSTKMPFVLLLISPVPAALTIESPHALRALTMLPFLLIISALGLEWIYSQSKNLGVGVIVLFLGLFIQFYLVFINSYFLENKQHWQYAYYQDIVEQKKMVVSDKEGQPYIFYLFYNQYDPKLFREQVQFNSPDKWGVSLVNQIGEIKFVTENK